MIKKFMSAFLPVFCITALSFGSILSTQAQEEPTQPGGIKDDTSILWTNIDSLQYDQTAGNFWNGEYSRLQDQPEAEIASLEDEEAIQPVKKNQIVTVDGKEIYLDPNGNERNFNSSERSVVNEIIKVYETQGTDLQKLFEWTRDNISWKDDPLDWPIQQYALQGFRNGEGNCFTYAAVYYYLARFLGYDAQYTRGHVQYSDGSRSEHGWVMIRINGKNYMFDPQASKQFAPQVYVFMTDPKSAPIRYVFPDCDYPDVFPEDENYEGIHFVTQNGIMSGFEDFYFHPDSTITRGMIATILYRLEGSPEVSSQGYSDVPEWSFYKNASTWAMETGIMTGNEHIGNENSFDGENPITRQDLAVVFERYAQNMLNQSTDLSNQITGLDCDSYAVHAVSWILQENLMDPSNGQFGSKLPASRAVTATLIARLLA